MKLTIRDGILTVDDATVDEAFELATRLGKSSAAIVPVPQAERRDGGSTPAPAEPRHAALTSPEPPRIPTANKTEALLRFYNEIQMSDHKKLLRVLATAGSKGLNQDQLRDRAGMTKGLAGFGNSITKRTKAYGLSKADVLIVDQKGTFAQKRIQVYRLSAEMLDVMRENGLVEPNSAS